MYRLKNWTDDLSKTALSPGLWSLTNVILERRANVPYVGMVTAVESVLLSSSIRCPLDIVLGITTLNFYLLAMIGTLSLGTFFLSSATYM